MNIGSRLQIDGPCSLEQYQERAGFTRIRPWTVWRGHGSDEYGNCSAYFKMACLGGVTFFWEPPSHFQRDVELPAPGVSKWIDRRYFRGLG